MPAVVLAPAVRAAADRLVTDLERVFGTRLQAVIAYEPAPHGGARDGVIAHSLALVETLRPEDLTALLTVVPDWHKGGLATPLLLTGEEFQRTLDVFPLEYGSILARHVVLRGALPAGVRVSDLDLRRASERQIKGHLIHLREGFLETHGRPAAIAELVRASIPPFRAALANVARMYGDAADTDEALAAFAVRTLGPDGTAAGDVLRLAQGGPAADVPPLFSAYLRVVEQLWQWLDEWNGA